MTPAGRRTTGTEGAARPDAGRHGEHALVHCDRNRVLLVDDEEAIRRLFHVILTSALPERRIETASNGAEAIDLFGRGHHAVLLMDLHMPVMDGQVAFREIEKLCRTRRWEMPAVVFCTGFVPPDTVLNVVEGDALHGLILKPVSTETLLTEIRTRLEG